MATLQALWNKASRSSKVSDLITEKTGKSLLKPNATRWNSTFYAVERVLEFTEDAVRDICTELKIGQLKPVERDFLKEYTMVNKFNQHASLQN